MPYTLTQLRVLRAPPERVYRAFLDPAALAKLNAPVGFTVIVHELDASVGGRFRISFVNFGNGQALSFGGEFRELVPNEKIVRGAGRVPRHDPGRGLPDGLAAVVGPAGAAGGGEIPAE